MQININIRLAYLLVFWTRRYYIVHQDWHQFGHSMHSCGVRPVLGGTAYGLSLGLGLLHPLSCYRVYDVENSELVSSWCLLEVCV